MVSSSYAELFSSGPENEVDYLLNVEKVNPNPQGNDDYSPLYWACKYEQINIVKLLIRAQPHPADAHCPVPGTDSLLTPLFEAIRQGNVELLNILIKESAREVNVNHILDCNETALTRAVHHNEVEVAEFLIEAGADPNLNPNPQSGSCSPLAKAISKQNLAMCKLLLQNGSNPNERCNRHGEEYMIIDAAAYRENTEIVQSLVEHGATFMHASLFEAIFIKDRVHNLEYVYRMLDNEIPIWNNGMMQKAIGHRAWLCVKVLLSWGFYTYELSSCPSAASVLHDAAERSHQPATSVFYAAVDKTAPVEILKLLIELKPNCLQEDWMVNGNLPMYSDTSFTAQITETRKYPPTLDNLCRANVFQHLGINPLPKVMKLPLPSRLKEFLAVNLHSAQAYSL